MLFYAESSQVSSKSDNKGFLFLFLQWLVRRTVEILLVFHSLTRIHNWQRYAINITGPFCTAALPWSHRAVWPIFVILHSNRCQPSFPSFLFFHSAWFLLPSALSPDSSASCPGLFERAFAAALTSFGLEGNANYKAVLLPCSFPPSPFPSPSWHIVHQHLFIPSSTGQFRSGQLFGKGDSSLFFFSWFLVTISGLR